MSYPVRGQWRGRGGRMDPLAPLEAVQERVNRLLGDAFTGYRGRTPMWHPDVDVEESGDGWTIEVRLPGVAPDEVAVDITDRDLWVRSVHEETEPAAGAEATEEAPGRVTARRYADFSYRLTMPADVDAEKIDAAMDHGLLTVRLPRSTTSRTRRVSIGQGGRTIEGKAGFTGQDQAGSPAG